MKKFNIKALAVAVILGGAAFAGPAMAMSCFEACGGHIPGISGQDFGECYVAVCGGQWETPPGGV